MRRVLVWIDGQLHVNKDTDSDTPHVEISVDGKPLAIGELPKRVLDKEPEEIGTQVSAFVKSMQHQQTCTKIAPGRWAFALGNRDSSGNENAKVAPWSHLAVISQIYPELKPPKPQQPYGIGAAVEGKCLGGCGYEAVFVKSRGEWVCQGCGHSYVWSELLVGQEADIVIVAKGVLLDDEEE